MKINGFIFILLFLFYSSAISLKKNNVSFNILIISMEPSTEVEEIDLDAIEERHLQQETLNDMFDHLDKADGTSDGKIERKALVKWVSAMDLQKRIDFEANLNISPQKIDRILSKVHNIAKCSSFSS